MASVKVDLPFELQNNSPVDAKQNFKTLAEMKNFDERFLSDTAMCTCDEDGKLYIFNKLNTVDPDTGKWREVQGEGTSAGVDEMTVTELTNFLDTLEINAVGYVPPVTP